jgi:hypothetical protein
MATRFKWTGPATVTRSRDNSGGRTLEPQHIYATADFDPAVIEEWAKTGNAEFLDDAIKPTDTKLDVKNAVVSAHALMGGLK